jgi:hypothetical protein
MSDEPYNHYPWGPHGGRQEQPGPPVHPGDAQTPYNPVPVEPYHPISSPTTPYYPSGPSMPAGDVLPILAGSGKGDFVLNLIFVGILWEVWICLYPLSALAGLVTLLYSMPFLRSVLPTSPIIGPGLYAVVLGFVLAAIALWTASRLEHRLARSLFYRLPRHLVRLVLLGWATALAIQKYHGLPYNPMPEAIAPLLKDHTNLGIVIGVMVAAHFILWNWKGAREFWHRRLVGARLAPLDPL